VIHFSGNIQFTTDDWQDYCLNSPGITKESLREQVDLIFAECFSNPNLNQKELFQQTTVSLNFPFEF